MTGEEGSAAQESAARSPVALSSDERPRSLWRNADFMKLWGGETLSQVGSEITRIALPLLAIVTLGAGAGAVGLLAATQYAPILLFSLSAGLWLDKHRRKPTLVVTNFGRALLLGLVPLLVVLDALSLPLLFAIVFAVGSLTAFFDVAYVAYVPELVPREQLVDGNAKLEATYSVADVGGPGLGGILVQALSAALAVLVDAVTYVVAGLLALRLRHREPPVEPRPSERSGWQDIREGLAVTLGHPVLRPIMLVSAAFNLFATVIFVLYLLFGVRDLHLSAGVLGVLLTIGSAGRILGTVLAERTGRRFGVGPTVVWSMALASVPLGLIPAARGSTATVVLVITAGLVVQGIGLGMFNVFSLSLRAMLIPSDLLARVTGTYRLVTNGTLPLAGLLAGLLGDLVGVRATMAASVVLLSLCCAAFVLSRVRTFEPDPS